MIFQVLDIRNEETMELMHMNHTLIYHLMLLITHQTSSWIQLKLDIIIICQLPYHLLWESYLLYYNNKIQKT